jgi:hypothetical protein
MRKSGGGRTACKTDHVLQYSLENSNFIIKFDMSFHIQPCHFQADQNARLIHATISGWDDGMTMPAASDSMPMPRYVQIWCDGSFGHMQYTYLNNVPVAVDLAVPLAVWKYWKRMPLRGAFFQYFSSANNENNRREEQREMSSLKDLIMNRQRVVRITVCGKQRHIPRDRRPSTAACPHC